jgi:hypothetical protein
MGRWIAGFMVLLHATRGIVIAADRVIEDQTTATMIFRKVAVPASIISQQYALERARQFLLDNSGAKMIRLTMVPDAEPATYSLMGCDHCDPYRFWRMQWEPVSEVPFSIAELMSIERNAVLRYRDTKGAVSVTVIQGNDPRPISIGNYQGRMIHVGMAGRINWPLPKLYVVGSGTIQSTEAAAYIRDLAARLGVGEATIEFRSDPWFIHEIWTPFFPLFDTADPVPTEEAFKASKTSACFYFTPTNNRCSWEGDITVP